MQFRKTVKSKSPTNEVEKVAWKRKDCARPVQSGKTGEYPYIALLTNPEYFECSIERNFGHTQFRKFSSREFPTGHILLR